MATASGTAEWLSLLMSDVMDGPINPHEARQLLCRRSPILATDCKSLYDHLVSPSAPTSIEDRRTSIDVVIVRESMKTSNGQVRWLPTDRMIADGLTKNKLDPVDLLRSCIRQGTSQISAEDQQQAAERARRKELKSVNSLADSPVLPEE